MTLFSFFTPTPVQVMIVLTLGVLFFGKNLPEVARKLGLSLLELKKGLNEFGSMTKEFTDPSILMTDTSKGPRSKKESSTSETPFQEPFERQDFVGTKFEPPT